MRAYSGYTLFSLALLALFFTLGGTNRSWSGKEEGRDGGLLWSLIGLSLALAGHNLYLYLVVNSIRQLEADQKEGKEKEKKKHVKKQIGPEVVQLALQLPHLSEYESVII